MKDTFDGLRTAVRKRGSAAFLLAAVVLGVLVGFATAVLAWMIEAVEVFTVNFATWSTLERAVFLVTIPAALTISWALNRKWGPGVSSGGVTETMVGLSLHGGYLPTRVVPAKLLATAVTLGAGGSGGREGPIALIGATIGSSLARYTNFDHDKIRSLVAAGAGAGIGASFNAPIAGMLFAMEVILGSFAIRHLNAVVIASVGAAVTSHILLGDEQFLTAPAHALGAPSELVLYVGLAGIAVAFGLLYLRALDLGARYRLPAAFPGWMFPVVAGLIVGAIGLVAPNSLGTGHRYLSELLALEDSGGFVWYALGALALAKIVTSVFTRSGGGSAGTFMPSLFIGGAVGAGFAILIDPIWTGTTLKPGAFAIVGMAAVFATIARAPMTSVIIMFELTGNYELVLPLMLAAALATYAGERIHPANAYTIPLKRKGITLPKSEDIDLLDTVFVSTVMQPLDGALHPWTTLAEAAELFDSSTHHGAAVLSDRDHLVGILTLADIARAGGPSLSVTVSEAMSGDVITVTPDVPVSIALTRMASLGVGRLPVVSESDPRHVVGMFRRESVVKAYESALSMSKGRELYRERKRIRTQPGADFFEATVREGSPIANALVSEIAWPEHSVLVSIRRGTNVLVPHGKTSIRVGDVITSFGSPTANRGFSKLTEPGPSGDLE